MAIFGLGEWFSFTHTDGRQTVLKQTGKALMLVVVGATIEWSVYDPQGAKRRASGQAATFEEAQTSASLFD